MLGETRIDAEHLPRSFRQHDAGFLFELTADRLDERFPDLDPAARKKPAVPIGVLNQADLAAGVKNQSAHTDRETRWTEAIPSPIQAVELALHVRAPAARSSMRFAKLMSLPERPSTSCVVSRISTRL